MALLWEHSRTWRSLVRATRNPYILTAFVLTSAGGATALAWGSQAATDAVADGNLQELQEYKSRDFETARYAAHSKAALAELLDGARGGGGAPREAGAKPAAKLKLPPVQWHPGAVEREERAKRAKRRAEENAAKENAAKENAAKAVVKAVGDG